VTARVTARFLVSALIRRISAAGGTAMVLAKGDEMAGAIVLVCVDRGVHRAILERSLGADDSYAWRSVGPAESDTAAVSDYLARRRRNDPDLWLIELDTADAERFVAEMTGIG
jgi:hypothetical protein